MRWFSGVVVILLSLWALGLLWQPLPPGAPRSPHQTRAPRATTDANAKKKASPFARATSSHSEHPDTSGKEARGEPRAGDQSRSQKRWLARPWGSLYEQRRKAVVKGLRWMEWYLQGHWSYTKLGVDAVYIFLEIAQTSVEPALRVAALHKAQELALRMVSYYTAPGRLKDPGDLLDALDLLAEAPHLKVNMRHLLRLATTRYRKIKSARALYQIKLTAPASLSTDDFFDLLINTYIMQKLAIVYPGRFPVTFRLEHLLPAVMKRKYLDFPAHHDVPTPAQKSAEVAAEDDGFLATHVAYVFNFYGRIRLYRRDLPSLYKYLRKNFAAALLRKDIELVAEFVDVFRSLGRNETNDPLVRKGTFFLLESQAKDGSWGPWKKEKDPYDAIHYTWCAVLGLRERFFLTNTAFEKRLRSLFRRLRKSGK